jgi:parvulin-like peptidyl-prolyl isomerase
VAKKKKEEKPREYTRRQLSHFQKQKRRQRIIFISGISVIVAIILIVSVGWYMTDYHPLHRTVIKVGSTKFDTSYYIDTLKIYNQIYNSQASTGYSMSIEQIDTYLPNIIIQNELIKQGAEPLGITISDADIKKSLESSNQSVSAASIDIMRAQQLETRIKDEYIGVQKVPVSDNQVHIMAMMVEDESVAEEVREKILNGDNFTTLVANYGKDSYSKTVNGDFGLHPRRILNENLDATVPIDYAFGADAGSVSPPLADNTTYKTIGYWLINVTDRPSDNESTVEALYLSDNEQALDIKARLEAGDNLTALADQYSQYSDSKEKHGEMGVITKPTDNTTTAVSTAFDGYVFDPNTELGKWSDPIPDTLSTQGGYWLVKVVEKEIDAKLTDTDRSSLIDMAYSDWLDELSTQHASDIDQSGLTSDIREWAIARAENELALTGG